MTADEVRAALEELSYEEQRAIVAGPWPRTWYPDLLRVMVRASLDAGVWVQGGVQRFVKRTEIDWTVEQRKGSA